MWKLFSKLHNLTRLHLEGNKLKEISPLIGDLVHLQHLHLGRNSLSAEGVVGVGELLKVCLFSSLVDCGGYFVGMMMMVVVVCCFRGAKLFGVLIWATVLVQRVVDYCWRE